MDRTIVIVGSGAAGLVTGLMLRRNGQKNVVIVSGVASASRISPWNTLKLNESDMRAEILRAGAGNNDPAVLDAFLSNLESGYKLLTSSIPCAASNLGIMPSGNRPGLIACDRLLREYLSLGGTIHHGIVNSLLYDGETLVGVRTATTEIFGDAFVMAFGGLGSLFEYSTYKLCSYNLLALMLKAGICLSNLQYNLFHPFLIVDKSLPRTMFSGTILRHMRFIDRSGREFLSQDCATALRNGTHHGHFDRICREFYQLAESSQYYGVLEMTRQEISRYLHEWEYGWMFSKSGFPGERPIELHPAFHYSIGGIKVDRNGQSSAKNVYAVGECATGLHGASRTGGTGILDCVVSGGTVASFLCNHLPRMAGKHYDREIVVDPITSGVRRQFWEAMGPMKVRSRLCEIYERSADCDNFRLLQEMARASLEASGAGTHYIA